MNRGTRLGISSRQSERSTGRSQLDPTELKRDYNFLKGSLHPDIEFSRNSGATMNSQEGKICYAPENLITYTDDFSNSQDRFTYRSGHSISHTANQTDPNGGTDAALFANVTGSSANDFWKTVTGLGASAPYIPSFFIKRVSTTGTIRLANPVGGTSNWHINMAALPDDWVRITPSHSAVTVNTPFTAHTNGSGGLWFRSNDGSALSFYLAFPQVERTFDNSSSGKPLDFIENKSGSAVFKERLDHVPETGEKRGFLIEEARTNLFPRSDTNTWEQGLSNDSVIRLNNYAISPAGVKDAPKFITTSNNVLKIIAPTGAHPTIGTSTLFTFSCFIKKGNTDYVRMYHNDSTSFGVTFNLATGQVHSTTNNGDSNIEDYGNDWYRCWYSHTTPSTHSVGSTYIYPTDENSTITHANEWSVYLWQPQAELGGFLTSLIPTYGATADRAADIASVSGSNFSRWFKDTEGTTIVDAQVAKGFDDENSYPRLYSYNDGTTADMIRVYLGSSNKFVGSIRKNSTAIGDKQAPLDLDDDDGGVFRFGQLYKNNRHVVFTNGVQGEVDTTVDVPEDLTQLNIGNRESGAASFNGWIRRFRYFNKAKADAQVLNLTDSSKLLDRYRGAKAAHSLRSLRDGRDNSPIVSVRRSYDSAESSYSAAQVSNGELEADFQSEKQNTLPLNIPVEADEMIVGGDFTNLVINGDFATDSYWTKGTGWTIGSGVASCDGSQSDWSILRQDNILPSVGSKVTVTLTVSGYSAGTLYIKAGDGDAGFAITANGTYTTTRTVTGANQFRIQGDTNFVGSVDHVSVVEGSWGNSTGHFRFSGNQIEKFGGTSSENSAFTQSIPIRKGRTYRVEYDVTHTSGNNYSNLYIDTGSGNITTNQLYGSGHISDTFTALTTKDLLLKFYGIGDFRGFWDNVSVKEVNTNSATGFSTRLINSDYKGKPLMRIRNQSNVEAELYADANDQISLSSSIKGSSQNLLPSSEDFGTNWTLQTCTLEKYSGLDPFGGYNATKITATGGASSGPYHVVPSTASSTYHTFSIYIKAEEATRTRVGFFRTQSSTWVNVETNWSASGIPTTHASSNATNINYEAIGSDGWCRVSLVGITDTATYSTSVNIDPDSGGNNKSAIFFGAQLEQTQYSSTGTEKMTNGDFSNGSTGWTLSPNGQTVEVQNEALRIATPDGTFCKAEQVINTTAGKKYTTTANLTVTSGGLSVVFGAQTNHTSSGTISVDRIATGSSYTWTAKRFNTSGANDFIIDDISVKEYDPIVSEYAQTPVISDTINNTTAQTLGEFSGLENLLDYSEDYSQWANSSGGTGSNAVFVTGQTDPNGGTGATRVTFNKGSGSSTSDLSVISETFTSQANVASVYIRSDSPQRVVIRSSSTWIGVDTTTEWTRISHTDTGGSFQIGLRDGYGISNIPDTAEVYLWGAQVNTNSLKDYQKTTGTALTGDVSCVVWYCQNGNEDFTQSTADYQPRLVMGSELVTDSGGKASVYFDGSDNLINATLAGQNRLDAYLTLERGSNTEAVLMSGSGTQHFGLIYDDGSTGQDINLNFGTPSEFINGSQLATTATRNDVHDKLNDQSLYSITNGSTSGFSNFWMGWYNVYNSAFNYNGKISEMVFFPNMDSSPKRFNIEQNMLNHFDVGLMDIDFEGGVTVTDLFYKSGSSTIGEAAFSAETTNPISGTQSLKVAITGGNNASYPRIVTEDAVGMTEDAKIGTKYRVTFDTKLISGTVRLVGLGFADGGNGAKGFLDTHSNSDDVVLSGSQSHSFENTITELTASVSHRNRLFFSFKGTDGDGVFLIDNIKIKKLGVTGYVTKLYDQTGNNCHALQDTAAHQCQIVSGGDLIKSGNHPAWEHTDQTNLELHGKIQAAHLDAWFVHDTSDDTFLYPSNGSDYGGDFGWVAQTHTSVSGTGDYGGSDAKLYVNGTLIGASGSINRTVIKTALTGRKLAHHQDSDTADWQSLQMGLYDSYGNGYCYQGKFSEWIWFDSDESSNRTSIDTAINDYYNIYS